MLSNISVILDTNPLDFMNSMNNNPVPNQGVNPNNGQDPVRWWPSGVPQTWTLIGSSLAVYRLMHSASPRVRVITAIGTLGVTVPSIVYTTAVENPNGFNRLIFSWMEYRRTGRWPSSIPNRVSDAELQPVISNMEAEVVRNNPNIANDIINNTPSNSNSFHWSGNDDLYNFFSGIFNDSSISSVSTNKIAEVLLNIFRPVAVEGHLDDLIGQQLFIQMLLLVVCVGVLLLFISFIVTVFMLQNKDFVLKRFSNKYIKLYLNYQVFLWRLGFIILPIFILFGILELIVGNYYLITHTIPYDQLPVDLHMYVKS